MNMPRWKKGTTKFTARVISHKSRGYYEVTIPKPIIEALGDPRKIAFKIKGKRVKVEPVKDGEGLPESTFPTES
ncbi:MAG: hypothetical protein M1587_00905 [Thaumarchaeota archaeon]|nr:hypothetical protein [Nitrososphaerota archaeon]